MCIWISKPFWSEKVERGEKVKELKLFSVSPFSTLDLFHLLEVQLRYALKFQTHNVHICSNIKHALIGIKGTIRSSLTCLYGSHVLPLWCKNPYASRAGSKDISGIIDFQTIGKAGIIFAYLMKSHQKTAVGE